MSSSWDRRNRRGEKVILKLSIIVTLGGGSRLSTTDVTKAQFARFQIAQPKIGKSGHVTIRQDRRFPAG